MRAEAVITHPLFEHAVQCAQAWISGPFFTPGIIMQTNDGRPWSFLRRAGSDGIEAITYEHISRLRIPVLKSKHKN